MNETLIFGLKMSAIIVAVVFLVAVLIQLGIGMLVRFDIWLTSRTASATEGAAPAVEAETAIPPELIVAISAAVAVATDKKVRIKRIRYRHREVGTTWAVQGRATLLASHKVKS